MVVVVVVLVAAAVVVAVEMHSATMGRKNKNLLLRLEGAAANRSMEFRVRSRRARRKIVDDDNRASARAHGRSSSRGANEKLVFV